MARWSEIEAAAPALAALARERFDAFRHKTLATLRADGSPRISGIELEIADGDAWIGSMWRAVKALDLQRDPRFAIHSGSPEPEISPWPGDAKLAGHAIDVTDAEAMAAAAPERRAHRFRLDIIELVVVRHGGDPPDHLVIESWHEGRGASLLRRS